MPRSPKRASFLVKTKKNQESWIPMYWFYKANFKIKFLQNSSIEYFCFAFFWASLTPRDYPYPWLLCCSSKTLLRLGWGVIAPWLGLTFWRWSWTWATSWSTRTRYMAFGVAMTKLSTVGHMETLFVYLGWTPQLIIGISISCAPLVHSTTKGEGKNTFCSNFASMSSINCQTIPVCKSN